jgi:predicted PurR-regulated permease PerM
MTKEKIQHNLLYVLLAVTTLMGLFIVSPYFEAVFMAMMFAILFRPVHKKMEAWVGGRAVISSLAATLSVMFIVLIPISLIGFQVFQEAKQVYLSFMNGTIDTGAINMLLQKYMPQAASAFSADINQYIAQGLQWLMGNLSALFSSVVGMLIEFFLILFVLFFIFKDGELFRRMLLSISPFDDRHNEELLNKIEDSMASVIKGTLIVAVAQGALAGIGYMITGVPNPVLWGVISIFASLVPGIGTALVVIPALIFLVLSGNIVGAIALAFWGFLLVGGVDNLLRPALVGKGAKLHPLIVLLSALGGIQIFGFIGFLVGPVIFSILAALIELYPRIMQEHTQEAQA